MKIELFKDARNTWCWRTRATNGRIIADGAEGYLEKRHALAGALRVHRLALPERQKSLRTTREMLVQPGFQAARADVYARWERGSLIYAQWSFPDRSFIELVVL